jgi:hypothetical protein
MTFSQFYPIINIDLIKSQFLGYFNEFQSFL